jgi:hypothetical protein
METPGQIQSRESKVDAVSWTFDTSWTSWWRILETASSQKGRTVSCSCLSQPSSSLSALRRIPTPLDLFDYIMLTTSSGKVQDL